MPKAVRDKRRLHNEAAALPVEEQQATALKYEPINFDLLNNNKPQEEQAEQPQPQLKKKDKQRQRHEAFMQKLNRAATERLIEKQQQQDKAEAKEQKKKEKLPDAEKSFSFITNDLFNSLMAVEEKEKDTKEGKKQKKSTKPNSQSKQLTFNERKDQEAKEIEQFKNVAKHPAFVANPFATLKEHLTNSVALQLKEQALNTNIQTNAEDRAESKKKKEGNNKKAVQNKTKLGVNTTIKKQSKTPPKQATKKIKDNQKQKQKQKK